MSDNPKEAVMEKAIFISADCWLKVFDLLPPSQLGLGIAMISHRFDYYVDEHFKTRKWTLDKMEIRGKIGENGTEEMEIVNSDGKELPTPHYPLPNKVIGFKLILINFIDQNVLTFPGHFHRFFATSTTKLFIRTENIQILEFLMRNIWPMFKATIRLIYFHSIAFGQIRQFAPLMLNDCPSLHVIDFDGGILPEFPPDDSANASDGQAVAKWLFTPRPDNLTKVLSVKITFVEQLLATMEHIKAAFFNASSPVSFVIFIDFPSSYSFSSLMPFQLTNEFTGEKLKLSQNANDFLLIRFPIAVGDLEKWIKEEMDGFNVGRMNKIGIMIKDDRFDKSLFDDVSSAVPCGDQKHQK